MKIYLFNNNSQNNGPKRAQILGFDGGHHGVVIRKFGENLCKTACGAIFFNFFFFGHNYISK